MRNQKNLINISRASKDRTSIQAYYKNRNLFGNNAYNCRLILKTLNKILVIYIIWFKKLYVL